MKLNQIKKTTSTSKKRVGRGYGSGKGGHTAGRGQKGQKSRSKLPLWFEGGRLPLIHRLPNQRGKLRFKSLKPQPITINLDQLNQFKKGTVINQQSLIKAGLISPQEKNHPVKILNSGKLKRSLTITLPVSASAAKKITAAGGKINLSSPKPQKNE